MITRMLTALHLALMCLRDSVILIVVRRGDFCIQSGGVYLALLCVDPHCVNIRDMGKRDLNVIAGQVQVFCFVEIVFPTSMGPAEGKTKANIIILP